MGKRLSKLVYYDTISVTDYIIIMCGGIPEMEEIFFEKNNSEDTSDAKVEGKAGIKFGLSHLINQILGAELSANGEGAMGFVDKNQKSRIIQYTLKNTILNLFLDYFDYEKRNLGIELLPGYELSLCPDSLTYESIVPEKKPDYLKYSEAYREIEDTYDEKLKQMCGYFVLKGNKREGEKTDISEAKGNNTKIFRFNAECFWNNYHVMDLLIMDLDIYAVKTGTMKEHELHFSGVKNMLQDREDSCTGASNEKVFDVYDVLLAGIRGMD